MHVECGTLVVGTGEVIEDARLRIDDGEVAAVGPREDVEPAGDRVDHDGETVIPGLIDAHVHLQGMRSMDPTDWVTESEALGAARATADLRRLLDAGITTVRDVGSRTGVGLRDAVAAGEIPGPRVFTSGPAITQTGGHGDAHRFPREWVADRGLGIATLADGTDECRRTARSRHREGADLVKIMTTGGVLSERDAPDQAQFTDAEVAAMVEEAHRVGMPVACHAQGAPGIVRALENGVDTIEHGFSLDDESLALFAETGATFVPTLAIVHRIVTEGDAHGVPAHAIDTTSEVCDAHVDSVRRARDAGVPIATGTDFMGPDLVPHGENALELELLVEHVGFSPHEALQAATRVAARTLPATDLGTLEAGNRADFVALSADPLTDVGNVRAVAATYVGGERRDGRNA